MRLLFASFFVLLLTTIKIVAQDSPVDYTWKVKHLGGSEFEIIFKAKIKDGWHTYSQFLESNNGPVPTSINFESNNETPLGKAIELTAKEEYKITGFDSLFKMELTKYKKVLVLRQKLSVKYMNKTVSGYLEYMACSPTRCMPPTAVEFSFIPASFTQQALDIEKETPSKTE